MIGLIKKLTTDFFIIREPLFKMVKRAEELKRIGTIYKNGQKVVWLDHFQFGDGPPAIH
jgi:hypothetical protein